MIDKINLMLIFLTANTGDDGMLKYNLFKWFEDGTGGISQKDAIIITAKYLYNFIFIISGMFMGYKLAKSIYVYNSHDVTALNKKQMAHEIMEPLAGMFMLCIGWIFIRVLVSSTLGVDLGGF